MLRRLLLLVTCLCLTPQLALAKSNTFGIGGLLYEHPGDVTLRLLFGALGSGGGYFGMELQPWRLGWAGATREEGQQSRPLALRAGAFLAGPEEFSLGIGFIAEGLKTGLPASTGVSPHGLWHGAIGVEGVLTIAPVKGGLLVMLFAGSQLAPDDQLRKYGELQFIFPVDMGSWWLGITGGVQVSSFVLRGVDLLTITPALGIFPIPKR